MIDTSNLHDTFRTMVEKQASDRGQTLTSFQWSVAQSILNAGLLAYEDRLAGKAQWRVVAAPTGSGKSSYAGALTAALIQALPGSSVLFLCETIDQCEDTYKALSKLVAPTDLAVWTSAHDASKSVRDIEREFGFTPSAQFSAKDLSSYRVAIVTHAMYRGLRGKVARKYQDEPRTLIIMDERPQEVAVFDIDQGDVLKGRDWALRGYGDAAPAFDAFQALHDELSKTWELERHGHVSYRGLKWAQAPWFSSSEATTILLTDRESLPGQVIGFARGLAKGYAFMSRYEGTTKGGRFVAYQPDFPILPGTMLLDATADVDGVSKLVSWRQPVPSPRVSFDNLTVTQLAPPERVIRPDERLTEVIKNRIGLVRMLIG